MKGRQKCNTLAHLSEFERVGHLLFLTQLFAFEIIHLLDFFVFFLFVNEVLVIFLEVGVSLTDACSDGFKVLPLVNA